MMKPRCILHIGMPKTGTSSIQETLYKEKEIGNGEYLKIGPVSNHSTIIYSLFAKRPELHHAHIAAQRTKNQVEEFVKYHKEQLGGILSLTQSRQYIISGEDILFLQEEELLELRSYLLQFSSEISVVAYVRPPISFMQSAFQQKIKEGDLKFGIAGFYPQYKNRFEKFDRVFGQDNVSLIKFHPDSLLAGDVVCDFCNRIGISIESKNISRENESISLEAIAFLFMFYKFGRDIGCVASLQNHKRAQELSTFGVRKFQYSKLLSDQIRTKIADDIQWMENRLACSLSESIVENENGISSEEDLIAVAFENRDNLAVFMSKICIEPMATPQDIADVVGRLGQYSSKPVFSHAQLLRLESPLVDLPNIIKELVLSLGRAGQTKAVNNILCKTSDLNNCLNKSLSTDGNIPFSVYLKKRLLSIRWIRQVKRIKDILNSKADHNKSLNTDCNISYSLDRYHDGYFMGWLVDNNNPLRKLSIEIRQAQRVIARGVANQFRQDLADVEIGDGCCAFVIKADLDWKNDESKLLLRVVDCEQEFEINTISN